MPAVQSEAGRCQRRINRQHDLRTRTANGTRILSVRTRTLSVRQAARRVFLSHHSDERWCSRGTPIERKPAVPGCRSVMMQTPVLCHPDICPDALALRDAVPAAALVHPEQQVLLVNRRRAVHHQVHLRSDRGLLPRPLRPDMSCLLHY